MTGDGHRTVTPAEHDSEAQTGGPEEAGAHQVLSGFAEARWGVGDRVPLHSNQLLLPRLRARIRAFARVDCRAVRSPRLPQLGHTLRVLETAAVEV